MILIDANVFMYAAGAAHPSKGPSARLLERVARGEVEAATDAEVLQEILHRYRAMGAWKRGRDLYELVRTVVPMVVPISAEVVDVARGLLDRHAGLSVRDALHAAACLHAQAEALCTYDRDFASVRGLRRLRPEDV